jgi:hypothetical protein
LATHTGNFVYSGSSAASFFAAAAEHYLLNHLERSFKTLDFYKEVEIE